MQGTTRSIIGSIIIIFVITAIVAFTNEDQTVSESVTQKKDNANQVNDLPPDDKQPNDAEAGERSIPQFAYDACVDLEEGVTCIMSSPRGEESGTCKLTAENALACTPERLN